MNNERGYPLKIKNRAISLRKKGMTHREIALEVGAGKSIVWIWTKGIDLSAGQKKMMESRRYKFSFTKERRLALSELARENFSCFWKKPYSKEELLDKIINFYSENGRIPLKREFNMYEEYRQRFGSWNNAIAAAGYKPNKVIFSKKLKAKDGHICDSFAEKIIDDWLYKNEIKHERNIFYQGQKMTADFSLGKIRMEYFGLKGLNKKYDQTICKKRKICAEQGLKLIEIYPDELFSKNFRVCLKRIAEQIKRSD